MSEPHRKSREVWKYRLRGSTIRYFNIYSRSSSVMFEDKFYTCLTEVISYNSLGNVEVMLSHAMAVLRLRVSLLVEPGAMIGAATEECYLYMWPFKCTAFHVVHYSLTTPRYTSINYIHFKYCSHTFIKEFPFILFLLRSCFFVVSKGFGKRWL